MGAGVERQRPLPIESKSDTARIWLSNDHRLRVDLLVNFDSLSSPHGELRSPAADSSALPHRAAPT
jgi:hypothetical protein